jgi:hypothetical protein
MYTRYGNASQERRVPLRSWGKDEDFGFYRPATKEVIVTDPEMLTEEAGTVEEITAWMRQLDEQERKWGKPLPPFLTFGMPQDMIDEAEEYNRIMGYDRW